jgi:hypothetical protein
MTPRLPNSRISAPHRRKIVRTTATGVTISNDEQNVVNYLATLMNKAHDNTVPDYHVSLDVNISFKRTSTAAAAAVIVTNDPNAVPVMISEEDIRKQYPWDYAALKQKLKNRYIDFKENPKYYALIIENNWPRIRNTCGLVILIRGTPRVLGVCPSIQP